MIRGVVQGVGFRPFVHRLAGELSLRGWVRNSTSGVTLEVEGRPEEVTEISDWTDEVAGYPEIPGKYMMYFEESRVDGDRILDQGERSTVTDANGDYRFNQFLTGSVSYSGEARSDSDPLHTLDLRVNAFF